MNYSGDIVDIKSNCQLIGVGEVGISSESTPILVTKNIHSCVAVLLITKECAAMMHINLDNLVDYSKSLMDVNNLLKEYNGNINKIQMFFGNETSKDKLEELKMLFDNSQIDVELYKSYLDMNDGSIAYDFSKDKYYGVDCDENYRNYVLGAINERDYFKEDSLDDGYGGI